MLSSLYTVEVPVRENLTFVVLSSFRYAIGASSEVGLSKMVDFKQGTEKSFPSMVMTSRSLLPKKKDKKVSYQVRKM